jgi:acyl-CoA thioesterase FadM
LSPGHTTKSEEVDFPGNLDVGTCFTKIGTKSFELGHGIFKSDVRVAAAPIVMVSFNYDIRRSVPISDVVREELLAL